MIGEVIAGTWIANAIRESASTNAQATQSGFEMLSESIKASSQEIANSIMSGANLIYSGLHEIASEMERQRLLKELEVLQQSIKENEDWLFDKGFLKEFYTQSQLAEKMYSHVKPRFFDFLDEVCSFLIPSGVQDDGTIIPPEERLARRAKNLYTTSDEDTKRRYESIRNCKESKETSLKGYAMQFKCHPIHYLGWLISERGIFTYLDDGDFWIGGTGFGWHDCKVIKTEISISREEYKREYKMGAIKLPFEFQWNSGASHTNLDNNMILEYLLKLAMNYEEKHTESQADSLKWYAFFNKLNTEISMANLRTLSQELSNFVRQKRIELS